MIKIQRITSESNPLKLEKNLILAGHLVECVTYHNSKLIVDLNDKETDVIGATGILNSHIAYEIEDAKRNFKDRINLIRDEVVRGGFPHTINGTVYNFDSDTRSGIRLDGLGVVSALALVTENASFSQDFRDQENNQHTLDSQGAFDLFISGGINEGLVVFKAVHIKENIIDAAVYANTDEIDAINARELWDETKWP